jgi:hypothetical protein
MFCLFIQGTNQLEFFKLRIPRKESLNVDKIDKVYIIFEFTINHIKCHRVLLIFF